MQLFACGRSCDTVLVDQWISEASRFCLRYFPPMKTFFTALFVCSVVSAGSAYAQTFPIPAPASVNPYPESTGIVHPYPTGNGPFEAESVGQVVQPSVGLPRHYGVVASVSQWHVQLTDARSVDLHPYTVIEPLGGVIRRGQRILVRGFFRSGARPGTSVIDARSIAIVDVDGRDH